jgi:hypothetical protein
MLDVLLNNGGTAFGTPVNSSAEGQPESLTSADFNGDGTMDIAVGTHGGDVKILSNDGKGAFSLAASVQPSSYPLFVGAADLNQDGTPDIVSVSVYGGVTVLLNDGAWNFSRKADYQCTSCYALGLVIADLNGDQYPDLVISCGYGLSLFMNNGDGTLAPETVVVPPGAFNSFSPAVGVQDVDGDGRPDIVVGRGDSATISVFANECR